MTLTPPASIRIRNAGWAILVVLMVVNYGSQVFGWHLGQPVKIVGRVTLALGVASIVVPWILERFGTSAKRPK